MWLDSWQQPPEDERDVEAEGVEGRAEHDRPNVPAYRANIVAAGHSSRLALIRTSSVLTAACTLVAEAATSLNLAGCTIVGAVGEKILLATRMPDGLFHRYCRRLAVLRGSGAQQQGDQRRQQRGHSGEQEDVGV